MNFLYHFYSSSPPLSLLAPMGWSSWCTNGIPPSFLNPLSSPHLYLSSSHLLDLCGIPDLCSEFEVRNKCDAMVANGMRDAGYTMMLLDDCWAAHDRDENGELQPMPDFFPSGMPALADYLHERGMQLGLYTCVGTETCKRNRPGSYGHFDIDSATFAKWGVDMVKADYCNRPSNETGKDLYYQFSAALNATGHPMLFATCQWGEDDVSEWGGEIAQMFRIQMDHIPVWRGPPSAAGAGYGIGTKNIIDFMADLHPSKYTRPHAWMDPDFLETLFLEKYLEKDNVMMNFTNSRTEFTFWALWSSPLLVATDPANLSEEKQAILLNKEVIAINQDSLFIAGERIRNDNETTGGQVWSRPLANGDLCVVLYNSGQEDGVAVKVAWSEVGWSDDEAILVRDLWAKEDVGIISGSYERLLPAHDVAMLRLSKDLSKK
jgi:alpha-galactosidase